MNLQWACLQISLHLPLLGLCTILQIRLRGRVWIWLKENKARCVALAFKPPVGQPHARDLPAQTPLPQSFQTRSRYEL